MNDPVSGLVAVAIALALYFIPTIVAVSRKHHNATAIFATNLLLGITGLGWVVALIWSLTRRSG